MNKEVVLSDLDLDFRRKIARKLVGLEPMDDNQHETGTSKSKEPLTKKNAEKKQDAIVVKEKSLPSKTANDGKTSPKADENPGMIKKILGYIPFPSFSAKKSST